MKDFFKKVWGWITGRNHYKHIFLSFGVAIAACVANSLFLPEFINVVLASSVSVLLVGIAIEVYQSILANEFTPTSMKNSIGDMFADILGGLLGILFFWLCMTFAPTSSFILYGLGILTMFSWFFIREHKILGKYATYILFLGAFIGIFGVFTFIFA